MKDKFYYSDSSNSFIGEIELQNNTIEFEIKLKESELDWTYVESFISSLNDDYLPEIMNTSSKLLLEFIKLVQFGVNEPFNHYKFKLEAITYYGKVDNHIFSETVDSFELVYNLYHTDYAECYDPYGNYIIKINNRLITGVRREQV